jgi:hypothetical protein
MDTISHIAPAARAPGLWDMDWFERLTGFRECGYENTRRQLEIDGRHVFGQKFNLPYFGLASPVRFCSHQIQDAEPHHRTLARHVDDLQPVKCDLGSGVQPGRLARFAPQANAVGAKLDLTVPLQLWRRARFGWPLTFKRDETDVERAGGWPKFRLHAVMIHLAVVPPIPASREENAAELCDFN